MGFVPQKRTYRLSFEAEDMAGLEVRAHSLSVGAMLDMARLSDSARENPDDAERMFAEFARALVSWNLEDETPGADGVGMEPIPATYEGLRSLDLDFALQVIQAWIQAVSGVPDPLAGNSSGGRRSVEASLPMEPLPAGL